PDGAEATEEITCGSRCLGASVCRTQWCDSSDGSQRVGLIVSAATHEKFHASSELPEPVHFATRPNVHNGRVRSIVEFAKCDATIFSGAVPVAIHCSSAVTLLKTSGPAPPLQWFIPGAMYSWTDVPTASGPNRA